jgi:putative DNA methylase
MAVIAEGPKGRVYIAPTIDMEAAAFAAQPAWKPACQMPKKHRNFQPPAYGMSGLGDLFTSRQLAAVTTFSDLVNEARERVHCHAVAASSSDDGTSLATAGIGATAYSEAVSVYLGCALSRLASYNNTICHWNMRGGSVGGIFSRHAIPMSWDFIEVNPLEKMSGNWDGGIEWVADVLDALRSAKATGSAQQADASTQAISVGKVVSTDPPYYDNISYADLSDFFYVWLRPQGDCTISQILTRTFSR